MTPDDTTVSPPPASLTSVADAPRAPPPLRRWPVWLAPAVLVLLSLALYAPSLAYQLVYDDNFLILQNESMAATRGDFGQAFALFGREYWEGVTPNDSELLKIKGQGLYRPLTLFAWACIYAGLDGRELSRGELFGSYWPYHLVSILANALAVLLLYLFVRRLTGCGRLASVASLLFALHPLHSEAVAYVAGLSDVLSACAVLGGLLAFVLLARERGRWRGGACVALLALFFVGLLAKEQAVLLLPACVLTEMVLAREGLALAARRRWAVYGGLLLVFAAHLALRWAAVGYLQPRPDSVSILDNPLISAPFGLRLATGLKLLAMQVWLVLFPRTLSIDYSLDAIPVSSSFAQAEPFAGLVLIGTFVVVGLLALRRWPWLCWGLLFFVGTALLTSNILMPIGTIFGERLLYLPSAGLCLAAAALAMPLLRSQAGLPLNVLGGLLVAGAATLLGLRTVDRNEKFETSIMLFEDAKEAVPRSARIAFQLGSIYGSEQLFAAAEGEFLRALDIHPAFVQAAISLGDVHVADKNYDKAIETYDRVLAGVAEGATLDALVEIRRTAHERRGQAKAAKGDVEGAAADLQRAIELTSEGVSSYLSLARLHIDRGEPAKAIPHLRNALASVPGDLTALYMLAQASMAAGDAEACEEAITGLENTQRGRAFALAMRGEMAYERATKTGDVALRQQALANFEEARQLDPKLATPHLYRGRYLTEQERPLDAILEFDRALKNQPRNPLTLQYKALAQLQARRPKDALATLEELAPIRKDSPYYDLLGMAHFALGNADEALAAYEKLDELGGSTVEVLLNRAITLEGQGRLDEALATLEQGLAIPDHARDAGLLRDLGRMQLAAGRFDEALSSFDQQAEAEASGQDAPHDTYLPINRARALTALGRDLEAAAALEELEASVGPDSREMVSLLHRRAELFLRPGGLFYDPAAAAELCAEALALINDRYDELLDTALQAHAAARSWSAGLDLARRARATFPGKPRYAVAEEAFAAAANGDVAAAVSSLRAAGDAVLSAVADAAER